MRRLTNAIRKETRLVLLSRHNALTEELGDAWQTTQLAATWKAARMSTGTSLGPKRRRFDRPIHCSLSLSQWRASLEKDAADGGLDVARIGDFPDLQLNECTLPPDSFATDAWYGDACGYTDDAYQMGSGCDLHKCDCSPCPYCVVSSQLASADEIRDAREHVQQLMNESISAEHVFNRKMEICTPIAKGG